MLDAREHCGVEERRECRLRPDDRGLDVRVADQADLVATLTQGPKRLQRSVAGLEDGPQEDGGLDGRGCKLRIGAVDRGRVTADTKCAACVELASISLTTQLSPLAMERLERYAQPVRHRADVKSAGWVGHQRAKKVEDDRTRRWVAHDLARHGGHATLRAGRRQVA